MCGRVDTYTYIHIDMCIYMCMCVFTCVYVSNDVYADMYTHFKYTCHYQYVYIYLHMHTHTWKTRSRTTRRIQHEIYACCVNIYDSKYLWNVSLVSMVQWVKYVCILLMCKYIGVICMHVVWQWTCMKRDLKFIYIVLVSSCVWIHDRRVHMYETWLQILYT